MPAPTADAEAKTGTPPTRLRHEARLPAKPEAVRSALEEGHAVLAGWGYPPHLCEAVELVVAEALNNVVEHAYAGGPGDIVLRMRPAGLGVTCLVYDAGAPMPDGPPDTATPEVEPDGEFPEGGFGWPLIRMLCERVRYRRHRGGNALLLGIGPGAGI